MRIFIAWMLSPFNKKRHLQKENEELAVLVKTLLSAIEDGELSKTEIIDIKNAAYDVVIKYNL